MPDTLRDAAKRHARALQAHHAYLKSLLRAASLDEIAHLVEFLHQALGASPPNEAQKAAYVMVLEGRSIYALAQAVPKLLAELKYPPKPADLNLAAAEFDRELRQEYYRVRNLLVAAGLLEPDRYQRLA